jgi:hypothetical protein
MDQGVKNKYICDPSVSASACKFYHISIGHMMLAKGASWKDVGH